MTDAGVIGAWSGQGFPRGSARYELIEAGRDLLPVAATLEQWLAAAPNGASPFVGDWAKTAIGAMVEGWSATLLRALAVKPLSIADLDSVIGSLNYPSLERRVAAMRHAGQVEARPANGRETPYAVTTWLRRGAAPLLAAIRWERLHPAPIATPLAGMDIEAILLLAMPLLQLDRTLSGNCRLAVELSGGEDSRMAGVLAVVGEGGVASCSSRLDGAADAWASGPVASWLRGLIDDDRASLELGGDSRLAGGVVAAMHRALFGAVRRRQEQVAVQPG